MGEYSLYNPSADQNQDSLAHYGRLGMKWYQHIFGEYQGAAKYAEKGYRKIKNAKRKVRNLDQKINGVEKSLEDARAKLYEDAEHSVPVTKKKARDYNAEAWRLLDNAFYRKIREPSDPNLGLTDKQRNLLDYLDSIGILDEVNKDFYSATIDTPYTNVMKTYEVNENGKKLKPEHGKVQKIETKLTDHRNSFLENNPPESEAFKRHLENRLKEMTTNDSDGEEIRNSIREETSALAKSGRLSTSSTGFEMAYADYCRNDSAYKKLNERLSKARDTYDTKANTLAAASYRKHGASAIDEWDPENVSQRAPKYAIDILAYLMKESCEGRR